MNSGSPSQVVILDRDGTIVIDRGYLVDPNGLEFMPGAAEGLRWLWERGYQLVVMTNQSGVGRGFFTKACVEAMHARLLMMVERAGAKLSEIYVCPHAPEDHCACRKPNLGLMEQAARELNFDPRSSVVVGDKASDVEFARRAGAKAILISPNPSQRSENTAVSVTVPTLLQAARAITSRT